jgi:hypothetical protein
VFGVTLLKIFLRLTKRCRGKIAKKFVIAKILFFRDVIFLGTRLGDLTVFEVKKGDSQLSEALKKGSGN